MKGVKLRLEILEECEKKTERDSPSTFFIIDWCNSSSSSPCVWGEAVFLGLFLCCREENRAGEGFGGRMF